MFKVYIVMMVGLIPNIICPMNLGGRIARNISSESYIEEKVEIVRRVATLSEYGLWHLPQKFRVNAIAAFYICKNASHISNTNLTLNLDVNVDKLKRNINKLECMSGAKECTPLAVGAAYFKTICKNEQMQKGPYVSSQMDHAIRSKKHVYA